MLTVPDIKRNVENYLAECDTEQLFYTSYDYQFAPRTIDY